MFEGAGLKLLFIILHENSVLIVDIGPEAGVGFGHLTAPCLFTQSYQTEARFRGFSTASTPGFAACRSASEGASDNSHWLGLDMYEQCWCIRRPIKSHCTRETHGNCGQWQPFGCAEQC